jgi:hypothetical protein
MEMGARQYVPRLGRFLEVDPVSGGSCSAYDYVCAEPVGHVDLDGTQSCCIAKCEARKLGGNGNCRGFMGTHYYYGVGVGGTRSSACKLAQKAANGQVARGCYKRHCKCFCWDAGHRGCKSTFPRNSAPTWAKFAARHVCAW